MQVVNATRLKICANPHAGKPWNIGAPSASCGFDGAPGQPLRWICYSLADKPRVDS